MKVELIEGLEDELRLPGSVLNEGVQIMIGVLRLIVQVNMT